MAIFSILLTVLVFPVQLVCSVVRSDLTVVQCDTVLAVLVFPVQLVCSVVRSDLTVIQCGTDLDLVSCAGLSSAVSLQRRSLRPHCRSLWHHPQSFWLCWSPSDVVTVLLSGADGPSPKKDKSSDRDRSKSCRAWVSTNGHTTVDNNDGKGRIRYEDSKLQRMLIELFKVQPNRAKEMCLGFALDQRGSPISRFRSCTCKRSNATPFDKNHGIKSDGIPQGSAFAVEEKYQHFR